jgi:hypothetical protein
MHPEFTKTMLYVVALTTFSGLVSVSNAATITYSNRAVFEATLAGAITDDYENAGYALLQSNAQMGAVVGQTQYVTTGHTDNNIVFSLGNGHFYCAGCDGSYRLDFTSTSVSTGGGVYGVGFDYANGGAPLYHAFITFGDNSSLDVALNEVFFPSFDFFGITSDRLIKTVAIGLANGDPTQQGEMVQDNLTIGSRISNAVPEPAALTLLGLGLLAIGATRRRNYMGSMPKNIP